MLNWKLKAFFLWLSVTSCEELTHWKRLWCWEGLEAGKTGANRGWDGWMVSPTRWTWVWVSSGSWWWTGRPGVLWFMGSQRVGHDWATELNWTEPWYMAFLNTYYYFISLHKTVVIELWYSKLYKKKKNRNNQEGM